MPDENAQYTSQIQIELLKKDITVITNLVTKIDNTIDKLQDISVNLSKMVSMQEQRIDAMERYTKELSATLESRRSDHNLDTKEINNRVTSIHIELTERIEDIEKSILSEIQGLKYELRSQVNTMQEELRKEQREDSKGIVARIASVETWRWMVTGGVFAAGWFLSKVITGWEIGPPGP